MPAILGAAAVITAVAVIAVSWVRRPGVPAWEVRPASLVVLPFSNRTATVEQQTLLQDLADFIGRDLNAWNNVRAARAVDLVGPLLDLNLGPGQLERIDDGLDVARMVGVQAMLAVTIRSVGADFGAEAQLYDVRSGLPIGEPLPLDGSPVADSEASARVVAAVLGLPAALDPVRALRAGTTDPDAALAYLEGLEELHRARLETAEERFRAALELDPAFPSAMTSLAQTLFWEAAENREQLSSVLGPEITRRSTAATDHLGALSDRHRLYVMAFYAFQLGDYEEARVRYQELLNLDPGDPLTLMMIGEVELQDPWTLGAEGAVRPRSEVNKALESLLETVRLVPTFELAYGHLLGIQSLLDRALVGGTCTVFDDALGRTLPPWEPISPSGAATSFCLAATDSLVWMSRQQYAATDPSALRDGADLMLAQFVTALERWASVSPGQPRAFEQLSDSRLIQRRRAGLAAPELLNRLGQEALEYFEQAVALRADTTAEQLVRLSNLHLAAGQVAQAIVLAEQAFTRYGVPEGDSLPPIPAQLGNALVAGGRTSAALAVASGTDQNRFVRSPTTGELISWAGAEAVVERVRVLGAVGVGGNALATELEGLERGWLVAGYSGDETQLLRRQVRGSVAPSLMQDSLAMRYWRQVDVADDPLWAALTSVYDSPALALDVYEELTADPPVGLRESTRAFVSGFVAGALGQHEAAIRLYSRLDSIPHDVEGFDPGWGLRVSSLTLRARHYAGLGDIPEALRHLESFIELRQLADSLSLPSVRAAEEQVLRLRAELPPNR